MAAFSNPVEITLDAPNAGLIVDVGIPEEGTDDTNDVVIEDDTVTADVETAEVRDNDPNAVVEVARLGEGVIVAGVVDVLTFANTFVVDDVDTTLVAGEVVAANDPNPVAGVAVPKPPKDELKVPNPISPGVFVPAPMAVVDVTAPPKIEEGWELAAENPDIENSPPVVGVGTGEEPNAIGLHTVDPWNKLSVVVELVVAGVPGVAEVAGVPGVAEVTGVPGVADVAGVTGVAGVVGVTSD